MSSSHEGVPDPGSALTAGLLSLVVLPRKCWKLSLVVLPRKWSIKTSIKYTLQ